MLNHLKAMINEVKPCNRWQESWTDAARRILAMIETEEDIAQQIRNATDDLYQTARSEEEENAIDYAGKMLERLTW